jgi:hypothetical protein
MNTILISDPHPIFVIKDYLSMSYSYIFLQVFLRASVLNPQHTIRNTICDFSDIYLSLSESES